ncbi:hypothetical protein HPP92_011386 [Vanilla planifolia]|uniref:Uncharacterized protein n=1 Tax=Vanilla planifolia TaxID=51239 RepID=A0A835RBE3_VANPL|nr:hypothetical protein HPP92_011386 [Vanilla planifolia]
MGCFLGCLRNKDDGKRRCQFFSKSLSWMKKDLWVPMNRYLRWPHLMDPKKSRPSEKMEREIFQGSFTGDEGVLRDLRQEAYVGFKSLLQWRVIRSMMQAYVARPNSSRIVVLFWALQLKFAKHQSSIRYFLMNFVKNSTGINNRIFAPNFLLRFLKEYLQEEPKSFQHEHDDKSSNIVAFEENKHSGSKAGLNSSALEKIEKSTQEMPILSKKEISWWLKAQSAKDETKMTIDVGNQPPKSDCSPNLDKQITGAASAFWNEEELCGALPKQWDGNGIPNTTTKYKEDQKVNWHTTFLKRG